MSHWQCTTEEALQTFGVSSERGLAPEVARARLLEHGRNQLSEQPRAPAWVRFVSQLRDVTVIALLVAAALAALLGVVEARSGSGSWLEHYGDSLAILLIVVLNATMGVLQEGRAHDALRALRSISSPMATVLRAGERRSIEASEVVLGDVVLLEEGDRVPADARLVEVTDLLIDEAALTGESTPVEKQATRALPSGTPLAERSNMVYLGSYVRRGSGVAVVTATGMRTEMGGVAQLLKDVQRQPTPLEREMQRFGRRFVLGCVVLSAVLFGVGLWRWDVSIGVLLLTVVSLAVAAIPEGLPAITTVVLALGVRRMAAANAVVRRLSAVEALGSAHVICSDKTGTLTQNRMAVRRVWVPEREFEVDAASRVEDEAVRALASAAQFAPAARPNAAHDGFTGDPTDVALLEWHARQESQPARGAVVRTIPFSAERHLASVVFAHETGERRVFGHGAPERVLERCTALLVGGTAQPLADAARARAVRVIERWAGEGLRVLALARRDLEPDSQADDAVERELTLLGFVALSDPPRPEVRVAIARARGAGIRTMMITGDHPSTARAIAAELGLSGENDEVLSSSQLGTWDDDELRRRVDTVAVVARATAADKLRIVRALSANGHVVAMTGDGVNDAPAIEAASIGVAMGKVGTDVSREVADLVLLDDNYATIVTAIEEGRRIYANVQRFVAFLFAANAGLVLLVALSMLLGWPAVLTPTQILWINLITNGLPALALGVEPSSLDPMARGPRPRDGSLLERRHWLTILSIGTWLGLSSLFVFDQVRQSSGFEQARTVTFTLLALGPVCYAFSARSELPLLRIPLFGNRAWLGALGVSLALQTVALFTPGSSQVFGTVPLSAESLGLVGLCVLSVLLWAEITKWLLQLWLGRSNSLREIGSSD